jgi:hypothetical protein
MNNNGSIVLKKWPSIIFAWGFNAPRLGSHPYCVFKLHIDDDPRTGVEKEQTE